MDTDGKPHEVRGEEEIPIAPRLIGPLVPDKSDIHNEGKEEHAEDEHFGFNSSQSFLQDSYRVNPPPFVLIRRYVFAPFPFRTFLLY